MHECLIALKKNQKNHHQRATQNIHFHYVADTQCFPYGKLSSAELQKRLHQLLAFSKTKAKLCILACNTLTTHYKDQVCTGELTHPQATIFGVTPAIDAGFAKGGDVLLVASPHTAKTGTIHATHPGTLIRFGSAELVTLAERRFFESFAQLSYDGNEELIHTFNKHIQKILQASNRIRVLVLGCTHFAFALEDIQKSVQEFPCTIIDSSHLRAKKCTKWISTYAYTTTHTLRSNNTNPTYNISIYSDYDHKQQTAIQNYLKDLGVHCSFYDLPRPT